MAGLAISEDVDENKNATYSHGDNLECDTSYDEIVATINELLVGSATGSCHASTDSLKHNGAEIAADKDPWIETRLDE